MPNTVLITGASSGIGRAAAQRFAQAGWNVAATMRNVADGADLAGENTLVGRLDVEDKPSIDAAVAATIERFGSIDVLVNNAGYGEFGVFETVAPEDVQRQFAVNVFGVMDVTRAVLPHMRARRAGTIINVSSGAGIFTLPMFSLYHASKFALEGFVESLSYELAAVGITAKLVIPHGGVTSTRFSERQQANRIAVPDYDAFAAQTGAAFRRMVAARSMSSADVADLVFAAATDGTDQLRYMIGDDARQFVKARREMSETDYVAFMRRHFA
jgi:NAD(P)-dependent dehydrogenase (short-subunit alcohol dehydrogenase family)